MTRVTVRILSDNGSSFSISLLGVDPQSMLTRLVGLDVSYNGHSLTIPKRDQATDVDLIVFLNTRFPDHAFELETP